MRNTRDKSRPQTTPSVDDHTNIAPVKDVKKLFDHQNQGGECDLMRVSRSERRRSSCPSKRRSTSAQKQTDVHCVDKDVQDASEFSCSESTKVFEQISAVAEQITVRSFKLAPSNKDRGASRRRVRKPVAVVDNQDPEHQEKDVAEHTEEPAEEQEPQQQEQQELPPVRRIKLRAASKNRKSIGRKRRTKHTIDVGGKSMYHSDDDAGSGSGSGSGESDEEEHK